VFPLALIIEMAMRSFGQPFVDVMELRLVLGDTIMEP